MTKIKKLLKENKGFMTFKEASENNIPYIEIKRMIDTNKLEIEEPGLYRYPNVYVDELFKLQYRYPKGIYSLETALWLHGLSLTIPFEPTMSLPYGTNTKLLKKAGIRPIVLRNYYEEGIIKVITPGGQMVKCYEVERTIVECLRPIYKIDVQIIASAFKKYAQHNKINYTKIFNYARMFKVQQKVQCYLEVL